MFQIGEFSRLSQISKRMLRYYDEIELLKPEQKDKLTGYRLYTLEQLPTINKIKTLRDLGFIVQEIKELMKLDETQFKDYLQKQEKVIQTEIKANQQKLQQLQTLKQAIRNNSYDMTYEVQIKAIPTYQVISLRQRIEDYFAEGQLWKTFFQALSDANYFPPNTAQRFAIYHDTEEYLDHNVDVEVVLVANKVDDIDGLSIRQLNAVPEMASILVYGKFENIDGVYHRLAQWLNDHPSYTIGGQTRQIPINGPWNRESATDYLTELQIPIKRKKP